MSDESLSQNQVENLRKAMETANLDDDSSAGADGSQTDTKGTAADSRGGDDRAAAGETPAAAASRQDAGGDPARGARDAGDLQPSQAGDGDAKPYSPGVLPGSRVTAYDFKRPERVGKDQMRAMQSLHESIARNFGASVSGLLRTMLEVKLLSVDQLTYSEFVFSLDNPSCFTVIKPEPLEGNWVLDIAPSLAFAIIDRMLGGDPVPGEAIRRPLTEIESRLMYRVVELFLQQIVPAWENVVDLKPVVETIETNPQLVQIVPPNEVAILIGFEVLLGKNRGMMNLCIPFNTIEMHNAKLSRNGWVGYGRGTPTERTKRRITSSIDTADVEVAVTLARSRIKTSDLLDLAVGDIITTDQEVGHPLELSIQNVPKFHASAGAYKGKKAVQIQSTIETKRPVPEELLDELGELDQCGDLEGQPGGQPQPAAEATAAEVALAKAERLLAESQRR